MAMALKSWSTNHHANAISIRKQRETLFASQSAGSTQKYLCDFNEV